MSDIELYFLNLSLAYKHGLISLEQYFEFCKEVTEND